MGSTLPPFQTSMSSTLGQTGVGSAMDTQKSSGLFGMDNKNTSISSGSSPFKNNDLISSGGTGVPMDHSTGIRKREGCMLYFSYLGEVTENAVLLFVF